MMSRVKLISPGLDGNDRVICTDTAKRRTVAHVYGGEGSYFTAEQRDAHAALIVKSWNALSDNYGGWIGPELLDAAADHCDDSIIADLLRARAAADREAIKGTAE